jgi:hypothetical protein
MKTGLQDYIKATEFQTTFMQISNIFHSWMDSLFLLYVPLVFILKEISMNGKTEQLFTQLG